MAIEHREGDKHYSRQMHFKTTVTYICLIPCGMARRRMELFAKMWKCQIFLSFL